jgi:hypothetical protein
VLGTLDDLVGNGTLVAAFDSYEFAQDALREALVQELSPERARTLHRRMADALLALYPDQPEQVVEAGWHLLRGGDDRRGADMLAQTAPRLATRGVATFSGLPALEAALALYEQQGRSPRECLTLRAVIVSSADRPAVMKYGESTLQQLYHYAGGPILARTSPWLGGRLAGALALVVMAVRRWLTPKSRRGPRALVAMGMFFRCAYSALIVRSATMDVAGMTRVATQMRAFSDSSRIGLITSLIFRGTLDAMRGRVGAARKTLQAARTLAGTDQEWQPDPASRRGILSAIYTPLGMLEAQHSPFGKRALDRIEEIAALGVDPSVLEPGRIEISNEGGVTAPELSMAVHQIRMMYHLARGERSLADQRIGKLRAATVQTGLSMQYDIFRLLSELGLAALTLDVAGLRRAHEMLLHYVKSYPHLSPFVALAQAYVKLSLRDDEGRAELAAWTARHKPGEISGWEGAYLSYMMLLLDAGESALARELAERALASDAMKDEYLTSTRATFEVLVARCQAEMGDVSQGRQRLARLMQDLEGADQSLTLGFVHEQAAYVAAASGDREACRDHLDRMKRWFAATRNPSLLMRAQTVIERLTKGSEPDWESDARTELRTLRRPKRRPKVDDVRAIFEGCQSLDERAARALHLIVEQTGGLSGHIYLVRDGKLQRMASLGEPNDDEIDRVLQDQFETASTNVDPSSPVETTSSEGGMVAAIEDRRGPEDHYATLMLGTLERDKTPLGAVRVRVSGGQLRPIAAAFLGAITHELAIDD